MKKTKKKKNDKLRDEYKLQDFPKGLTRGKYTERINKESNIVVIKPEVAKAFPNEEAVNNALESLINIAQKTTKNKRRTTHRRGEKSPA